MKYKSGREAKWRDYLLPGRLEAPFIGTIPEKTLADVKLRWKADGGKAKLLINFLDQDGNVAGRGEYASFSKREDALEAKREIIAINPKHKPEVVSVG